MLKHLLTHASIYTLGSLLVTLASFISFPIFTRLLTVDEYGVLNLISATLLMLVGLAKLGVQHSIVRFYGEIRSGKRDVGLREYYSTVLFGMAGAGLVVTILWLFLVWMVPAMWWNDARVKDLLVLSAVLVFLRVINSAMVNILRAQQRSAVYGIYTVLSKYLGLFTILLIMLYAVSGLDGFYLGTIVVESISVVLLFIFLLSYCSISPSAFSLPLYRAMLVFGVPMIAYEVAGIFLNLGDRYVIQVIMGGEPLGLYSAAYNLCEYVKMILVASVGQAIVPIYVRIWEEKGEGATRQFVERSLHFYFLLGAAVVAGVSAVGEELLTFMASEKYRAGAIIIPYVIAGMIIDGAMSIIGAGLYIHKQTRTLMFMVVGCTAFNIILNLVLVPMMGILGAAIATLVSYASLAGVTLVVSRSNLPFSVPWYSLVKFSVMALIMFFVIGMVRLDSILATLVVKVSLGAVVYAALVLLMDDHARDGAKSIWSRIRPVGQ